MAYPHDNLPLLEAKDRFDAIDIALYEFLKALQDDVSGPFDHREDDVALEAFSEQWARILHNELLLPRNDHLLIAVAHLYRGEIAVEHRWMGLVPHQPEVLRYRFKVLRTEPLSRDDASVKALAELAQLLYPDQVLTEVKETAGDVPAFDYPHSLLCGPPATHILFTDLQAYLAQVLTCFTGQPLPGHPQTYGQLLFSAQGFTTQLVHPMLQNIAASEPERVRSYSDF